MPYTVAFFIAFDFLTECQVKHFKSKRAAEAAKLETDEPAEIQKYIFPGYLSEDEAIAEILD